MSEEEIKDAKKFLAGDMAKLEGKEILVGKEEGKEEEAEVEGQWYYVNYRCWNCLAINKVPSYWDYFYCWNCGSANWS